MIVFKEVEIYSKWRGTKEGTEKVLDHQICDFTGEVITEHENPVLFVIDYNDNDPNYGDHPAEHWIYDFNRHLKRDEDEEGIDPYELFGQTVYVFKTHHDGSDVFKELLAAAKKAKVDFVSLDYLLRWSRAQMLEKVLKEKRYKVEQFIKD